MISILTPTYNRAYRLNRLYMSLTRQEYHDFEWIIIDDGSTDNTKQLYESWDKDKFNISYYYKENGGKHTALNVGVNIAHGDFIFIVDSDDYITDDALEKVAHWTAEIVKCEKFAGVSGLKAYDAAHQIGERPKLPYVDCTNLERKKYHLCGDKAEVYKREILLRYPFPEFEGEHYIPEDVVWNAIAGDGYRLRWYNDIIYIGEYLEDGLTVGGRKRDIRIDNFRGYTAREKVNVHVQKGLEKYMELGRYIDLEKKVQEGRSKQWTMDTLKISGREYSLGYIFYIIRKYGKKILGK